MSYLLRRLSLAAALLFVLFGTPILAKAASYYVSPNGSGSTCSSASPCALSGGLSKVGAGDELVLMDGRYKGLVTKRGGDNGRPITIRAANRHQAIIEWPHSGNTGQNVQISHGNIVVRGIVVDGLKRSWDNFRIRSGSSGQIENILIEDIVVKDGGHAGFVIMSSRNVIIRNSLIDTTGLTAQGEGLYISTTGDSPVNNVEIYGNTFRNFTNNAVDYKGGARGVNIHHNIFEIRRDNWEGFNGDGVIRSEGSNSSPGNYFQDNIVRNITNGANYLIRFTSNRVDVLNNVFINTPANSFIYGETTTSAVISGNVLCGGPTSGNRGNNKLNASQAECDAEVARITNELKSLPGAGSGFPAGSGTTPSGPSPCSRYLSNTPAPSPYGLAWNWLSSGKELLLSLICEGTSPAKISIGKANANIPASGEGLTYSWGKAYAYDGSSWNVNQPVALTCTGTKVEVADVSPADSLPDYWCNGTLAGTLPANASFFVGFTCIRDATAWQCGCTDASCTRSYWQLQGKDR